MEFNRKFFINGARPSRFLEADSIVSKTQAEVLRISARMLADGDPAGVRRRKSPAPV
jgi:hypothetical protein